ENGVVIEPAAAHRLAPLKPGDGVVFDAADWRSPEEREEGGRIFAIEELAESGERGLRLELRFGNRTGDVRRIRPGDLVWRTHDPEIDKLVRPYAEATSPLRRQPVRVRVRARQGQPLETEWLAGHVRVTVCSPEPLGEALQRAVDEEMLRSQLGRLG